MIQTRPIFVNHLLQVPPKQQTLRMAIENSRSSLKPPRTQSATVLIRDIYRHRDLHFMKTDGWQLSVHLRDRIGDDTTEVMW